MNKTVKRVWLKALKSGYYTQGQNHLAYRDNDGKLLYCCLGVLCNLGKERDKRWCSATPSLSCRVLFYQGKHTHSIGFPPDDVLEKAGLTLKEAQKLATLNDNNIGFDKVIKWIEENL